MIEEPLLGRMDSGVVNFLSQKKSQLRWLGKSNIQIIESLAELRDIDPIQKKALLSRVSIILREYGHRAYVFSIMFHFGRGIVTVGSLIVPALLSIQSAGSNAAMIYSVDVYWVTWALSLLVTIFNGVLTLFKIEKKYFYLNTICEQVRSECWQFIQLTGKYGGHHYNPNHSTHQNELVYFTHALERIKLNQTNDEYWKSQENAPQVPNGLPIERKQIEGLFTPTPLQEQLVVEQNNEYNIDGSLKGKRSDSTETLSV
jgi:hypothetical protein